MNILPLLIVFLTILSMTAHHFITERISTKKELESYQGYMRAERLGRNNEESKHFQKIAAAKEPRRTSFNNATAYVSPRTKTPPSDAAKLNIAPLFSKNPPDALYNAADKLLKMLYGHLPNFNAEQILDDISEKKAQTLSQLLKESTHQETLYKMLKGTNRYDLKTKSGYPPLSDYVKITSGKSQAYMQFPYASEAVLTAFFGEKTTKAIIAAEMKKWEADHKHHTLTKDELSNLISKNPKDAALMEYIDFSTKRQTTSVTVHKDSQTAILLRRGSALPPPDLLPIDDQEDLKSKAPEFMQ